MYPQQRKRKNPWEDGWAPGVTYNQQQYRQFGFGGFQPTPPWQPFPYQPSGPSHFGCPMNSTCMVCQFTGYPPSMMQPPNFQTYNGSAGHMPYEPPPQQVYTGPGEYMPAPFQQGYTGSAGYTPLGYRPPAPPPPPTPPPPPPPPLPTPPPYYPPLNNNSQWYQGGPPKTNFNAFAAPQQLQSQYSTFPNHTQNIWYNPPQIGYNQRGIYQSNKVGQQQPPQPEPQNQPQTGIDTVAAPKLDHQSSNSVSQQVNETVVPQAKVLQVPTAAQSRSIATQTSSRTENTPLVGEKKATSDQSLASVEKSATNLIVQSVCNLRKIIKHEPEIGTASRTEARLNSPRPDQSSTSAKKPAPTVQELKLLKKPVAERAFIPLKIIKREPETKSETKPKVKLEAKPEIKPKPVDQIPEFRRITRSMSKAKTKAVNLPKRAIVHKQMSEIKAIKSTAVPAFGGFCSIASGASKKIKKELLDA